MQRLVSLFILLVNFIATAQVQLYFDPPNKNYAIAVHGGAGTITKKNISAETEAEIRKALDEAIRIGQSMLEANKKAVEVVERVVMYLEDSPLFNAGKGAVYNAEGIQEMDACIMDGKDLSCGAVAGVHHLKNPIIGARLVKDSTRHVLLSGERAEKFCLDRGADYADTSYFFVPRRWDQWKKMDEREKKNLDDRGEIPEIDNSHKHGTVGCVVLDKWGNLAAATSTGGLTYKKYGRIGDSPIVGAGTYASNKSCAVSCTGTGEFFIRGTIARDVAALMEYSGLSLQEAAKEVLQKLDELEGDGGFIAVDKKGETIMVFNTEGMYRASLTSTNPEPVIELYK